MGYCLFCYEMKVAMNLLLVINDGVRVVVRFVCEFVGRNERSQVKSWGGRGRQQNIKLKFFPIQI